MFNGEKWVGNFMQKTIWPYEEYKTIGKENRPHYVIYRNSDWQD